VGKLQEVDKEQKSQAELEAKVAGVQRELAELKMERSL
jgi:ribosomal protein L29